MTKLCHKHFLIAILTIRIYIGGMPPKVILILVGFLFLAISCEKELTPPEGVTLSIWESYNNEEHSEFIKLALQFEKIFEKKYDKKIKIKVGRVPFDGLLPKLKTACQTKSTPDICRVDVADVVPLSYGKAIIALDTLPTFNSTIEDFRKKFIECAVDSNVIEIKNSAGVFEKHLYGIPDQTTTVALFWNKKLFKQAEQELIKAGLDPNRTPKTWSEFVEYSKALSNPKGKIFAFGMDNSLWWTFPFFNTFGTTFVAKDQNGKYVCTLNSQQGISALGFKVGLFRNKYQTKYGETSLEAGAWIPGAINPTQGFINQKYAMILSGPWNVKTFKDAGIDFGISLVPEGPMGTSSNVGGTNMVIFKTCKYPEYALEFLNYIANVDYQKRWANVLGQIPVIKEAVPLVDTNKYPEMAIFIKQILSAQARPRIPKYDKLEEIINPEMELALKGQKTPKQALDSAVKRINEEILSLVNE